MAGSATGIGNFARSLLHELTGDERVSITAYGLTARGGDEMRSRISPSVRSVKVPLPAAPLLQAWSRSNHPRLSSVVGEADVYHGTNFVVPPVPKGTGAVVTVHDLTSIRYPELCTPTTLLYPELIQRAIDRGAWIHTPTAAIATEVVAHFDVDPTHVRSIHHGLRPVPKHDVDNQYGDYILATGTIEPRKDYVVLIRAFDFVAADNPGLKLIIAGARGWHGEAVDASIAASPYRDRILMLGYVGDEARWNLIENAQLLVYPSLYEGFGLPPLEAMQVKTPVVATAVPAVQEVSGGAAHFVPARNPEALAAGISEVLGDSALQSELRKAGQLRVKQFDWTRTKDFMVELYQASAG